MGHCAETLVVNLTFTWLVCTRLTGNLVDGCRGLVGVTAGGVVGGRQIGSLSHLLAGISC